MKITLIVIIEFNRILDIALYPRCLETCRVENQGCCFWSGKALSFFKIVLNWFKIFFLIFCFYFNFFILQGGPYHADIWIQSVDDEDDIFGMLEVSEQIFDLM